MYRSTAAKFSTKFSVGTWVLLVVHRLCKQLCVSTHTMGTTYESAQYRVRTSSTRLYTGLQYCRTRYW